MKGNATLVGFAVESWAELVTNPPEPLEVSLVLRLDDGRRVTMDGASASRYVGRTPLGARFDVLITEVIER